MFSPWLGCDVRVLFRPHDVIPGLTRDLVRDDIMGCDVGANCVRPVACESELWANAKHIRAETGERGHSPLQFRACGSVNVFTRDAG